MVKRLFIATLVAISPLYALAQGLITGHITDARNGESLIGASVIVKSEKGKGVVTDIDGNFSLQTKVEPPLTLRVEYVGYRPLDVDVYDFEEPVEIQLIDNASRLNVAETAEYLCRECPSGCCGRSECHDYQRSAWCSQYHPHPWR